MMTKTEIEQVRADALEAFAAAGIALTEAEKGRIEFADFGLSEFSQTGLTILTYVNTTRCCAKELILSPGQTCPEHRHPDVDGQPGKEETFRCRKGTVFLYVEGAASPAPACRPPKGHEAWYTVWNEVVLQPGEQYTLGPDTKHWFQGGPEGAVISEFSTRSRDEADVFTDPAIRRVE
jgi:D-lyxose ketol-isomerase